MLCSKHGNAGFQSIDKSICESIDNKESLNSNDLKIIKVLIHTGDEEFPVFARKFLFKKDTIDKYNLKDLYTIDENDDEEKEIQILKDLSGLVCVYCFDDFMDKNKLDSLKNDLKKLYPNY